MDTDDLKSIKIIGRMKFLDEEFDEALEWEMPRAGEGGRTTCGAPCCGT